jgi:hypothetical protein
MTKDLNAILLDDRGLHFVYGATITQPIVTCVRALPFEYRFAVGAVAGFMVGFFKELIDENYRDSPFSSRDLGFTTLGGVYSGVFG